MSLSEAEVTKIAKLARIRLNDDEVKRFGGELSGILDWVKQLEEVDTQDTQPSYSVITEALPLREGVVTEGNLQDKVLANTEAQFGCYVVPKVIE